MDICAMSILLATPDEMKARVRKSVNAPTTVRASYWIFERLFAFGVLCLAVGFALGVWIK